MSEQTQSNYSNIVSQVQAQNANALAALTEKAKKHEDMLQSLINEPIALASGELLQRGLFKVSKGVNALGQQVGSQTVKNVADAVSKGTSLTDAIKSGVKTDISKALGKAQQNASAQLGKTIKGRVGSSDLASRASTTLDTAKTGAEAKRSGIAQAWNDIKDKGTETRGVVSRLKSAFGIKENGTANFTTETSLNEQRAKIRETLAKTKGGRALNRKNDALDANRRLVQKQKEDGFSDLDPLSISGKKDSRLVAEKGVAPPTEATELDAFASGYSSLKKPEQTVEPTATEPVLDDDGKPIQDETERLRQKAEARGEEPDASLAPKAPDRVSESRSASSVLADLAQRETITGSAPRARKAPKQKPTPAPAPDPAPEQKIRPSDLTGGLDPSQLPADAGFKGSGGQKIEAAKPKGETLPAPEAPAVEKQATYSSLSQTGKQAHLEKMIDYQSKNNVSPKDVPDDVRNASLNEQSANDKFESRGVFASAENKAKTLADRKVLKKNQRKAYGALSDEGQQAVDDKATEYSKQTGVPVGQIPEQVRGNIINDQTLREQAAPPAAAVEPEQSGTSGGPVETQSAVVGEQTQESQSQVDSSATDGTVENRKTQLNAAGFNDDGKPDNENKGSSEEDDVLDTGGGIAATSVMDTLTGGVGALATGLAMAFLPKLWEKDPPPPPQMNQEDVVNPSDQLGDT
jgi:hypothetical protein